MEGLLILFLIVVWIVVATFGGIYGTISGRSLGLALFLLPKLRNLSELLSTYVFASFLKEL